MVLAPLTAVPVAASCVVQAVLLDAGGFGQHALRASHALTVTVQP